MFAVTAEEKMIWLEFKLEHKSEARDMIAEALRSLSGHGPWWFAIRYKEAKQYNAIEDVSRLNNVLGYGQDVLMVIL